MSQRVKYLFIRLDPRQWPTEDITIEEWSEWDARKFVEKVIERCPEAQHVVDLANGSIVCMEMPSAGIDFSKLANELSCNIYKKVAGSNIQAVR